MSNQFEAEHFHEPIYDIGKDVVRKLMHAVTSTDRLAEEGVEGMTKFTKLYEPSQECNELLPIEAETRYTGVVISDIEPGIVYASDFPPDYIVSALGSLSLALIDHLSYARKGNGNTVIFPPDPEWLKTHVESLWMTRPKNDSDGAAMTVIGTGSYPEIRLEIAREEGEKHWTIRYTALKRFALLRSGFKSDPVLTVPTVSPEHHLGLTDVSELTYLLS